MRDFYFITGMVLGIVVGGIITYKSKKVKQAMCECEKDIMEVAEKAKKATKPKSQSQEKKQ